MTIQLERGPQLYSPDTGKRLTLAQSRALTAMRAAFVSVLEAFDATGDETMPADGYPFSKCFREVTADVMEYVDSMDEPAVAQTDAEYLASIGIPPVAKGYARQWHRCRTCGAISYRDYVPYSLSTPIITTVCGHGAGERDYGMNSISENEAATAFAMEGR